MNREFSNIAWPGSRAIASRGLSWKTNSKTASANLRSLPDRSMTDFFCCMMAAQRGWSIEETASKLLEVSSKRRRGHGLVMKDTPWSPRRMLAPRQNAVDKSAGASANFLLCCQEKSRRGHATPLRTGGRLGHRPVAKPWCSWSCSP